MKYYPFKAFDLEFSLPAPAVWLLSASVVCGVSYYIYDKVYGHKEKELISQKQMNEQLNAEIEEYSLHVMEEPERHELFTDSDGRLALRVYKDHCVLIQRTTRKGIKTKLIIDLARQTAIISQLRSTAPPLTGVDFTASSTVYAAPLQNPCARGCLNPHPGPFQWRYGNQRGGGWIEVIRWWPEGCSHIQLFLPQAGGGLWDTNPDGTPKVTWTCCVH